MAGIPIDLNSVQYVYLLALAQAALMRQKTCQRTCELERRPCSNSKSCLVGLWRTSFIHSETQDDMSCSQAGSSAVSNPLESTAPEVPEPDADMERDNQVSLDRPRGGPVGPTPDERNAHECAPGVVDMLLDVDEAMRNHFRDRMLQINHQQSRLTLASQRIVKIVPMAKPSPSMAATCSLTNGVFARVLPC